jgi:hypothetical protein
MTKTQWNINKAVRCLCIVRMEREKKIKFEKKRKEKTIAHLFLN